MNCVITGILAVLGGYLLGSLLPAYFIARLKGFDIRTRGSGNPGISNSAATMGYPAAILVAVYDLCKAPVAILAVRSLGQPEVIGYLAGFAVIPGHRFPLYLTFKGGEGNAAAVAIGFYSLARMLIESLQFVYFLTPVFLILTGVFFLNPREKRGKPLIFLFMPILLNGVILYFGITVHTIAFAVIALYIIGQRLGRLLKIRLSEMDVDPKLLRRKWLRPLAVVFPIGLYIQRSFTLYLLGAVFLFFVGFEILRFRSKYNRFPLPYKASERSRISSMVMFLFATLLVLRFFQTDIASLSILFVIFGDLLAWAIGITIGGKGFLEKTWSGTAACFVTCFTLAAIFQKMQLIPLPVGLLGAVTATAVETAPIQDDNFIMPMASAVVMTIVTG